MPPRRWRTASCTAWCRPRASSARCRRRSTRSRWAARTRSGRRSASSAPCRACPWTRPSRTRRDGSPSCSHPPRRRRAWRLSHSGGSQPGPTRHALVDRSRRPRVRRGPAMSGVLRIANCSGFYGDRLSAASEMVEHGPIDVLTGDYLAELTLMILLKDRLRDPELGYARTFLRQLEDVAVTCKERGIRIVVNAGG